MTAALEAWALALGDLPLDEGLRLRTDAEVRFFPGSDPTRFLELCRVADLDAFLASASARTPRVILTDSSRDGDAVIPYDDFTRDADGRIDLPRLHALFDRGATVVLSQMHEMLAPLARFCRGLERSFMHPVQCNIYLTPPGAQGFRTHYDAHDVLILQVQGEKLWRYWPTPLVPFANTQTPWRPRDDTQPPPEEPGAQMMRPGDVLYIPRGVMHDAAAQGDQCSLHLTIGLLGPSWGDALRTALYVLERKSPGLRRPFPTWLLAEGEVSDELMREVADHLTLLGSPGAVELMSQQLLTGLAERQAPMVGRGLIAPTVSPTDRLRICDTVHHFVEPLPDGSAELRWAGGRIALTAHEFDWIVRLDEGASADELGGPEALAFCQRLASDGLLVVQPATP